MNHLMALLSKEWLETRRDTKRWVLLGIFLFFGLMSPLAAKLTPEIIRLFANTPDMAGIQLLIPTPDVYAAYEQFIKNITQMLFMAVLLVFMGIISQEKADGSAILILTKGVSRPVFLLSKILSSLLLTTIAYWLSVALFLMYTQILFDQFLIPGTIATLMMLWLYLLTFTSITMLASTLSKTVGMSALFTFGAFFSLLAVSSLPIIRDWSPILLASLASRFLHGVSDASIMLKPVISSILLIPICFITAVLAFKRQEL